MFKMLKPNKRCFTCGKMCFGYNCKECLKKGKYGSLTRRTANRRHAYVRENNATN